MEGTDAAHKLTVDAGVAVQQLEVVDHPGDKALNTVIVLTEPTQESVQCAAVAALQQLLAVLGVVRTIRMERLN